jgi:IclR family transcriptional regulator, pca regulon regulatory protein
MCAMRTTEAADVRRRDRNQVAALANGMRAIEAFAASRQRMTLAEVAKHSGLTRAAARRYLLTLVANGYPILMASVSS